MNPVRAVLLLALCALATAQETSVEPNDTGALDASEAVGVSPVTIPVPRPTIYGFVAASDQHTILKAVLDAVGNLSVTLDEPGTRFTLLAPTDSAFRNLANRFSNGAGGGDIPSIIAAVADGISRITAVPGFTDVPGVVFYHIIAPHYTFGQLESFGEVSTLQGTNLTFADGAVEDRDPSRGNTGSAPKNIFCLNGWIHNIFSVLLPFDLDEALRIAAGSPPPNPSVTDGPIEPPGVTPGPGGPIVSPDVSEEPEISPSPEDDGICFPSTARLHVPDGSKVAMENIQAGEHVVHDETGASSRVFLFTHRTSKYEGWFYKISTAAGHAVTMTGSHYLYANGRLTSADAVVRGDVLRTVSGDSPVTSVQRVKGTGLYAPHSVHGDLVVDGVVVSGYSRAVRPGIAHAMLAPVRWFVKLTGAVEPLGSVFYDGGRGLERFMPRGNARY